MDLLTLIASITADNTEFNKVLADTQRIAEQFGTPPIQLVVDDKKLEDGLKESEDELTLFEQIANGVWEGIKDGLKKAGIGLSIGKLVTDLTKAVNLVTQLGVDVSKGSKNLNISTKEYQEWSYALEQSGANINNLKNGISNINNLISDSGKVSDKTTAAFKELGLVLSEEITDEEGNVSEVLKLNPEIAKNTESFLTATLNALADLESAEDRSALAEAIFGKNNNLATLLDEGKDGIAKLKKEADNLGLVLSDDDIENAVSFDKTIKDMNKAIDAMKTSVAKEFLPYLESAAKLVTKIVVLLGGNGDKSLADQFTEGDEQFAKEITDIEGTSKAAETLADKLLAMGDTSKMTADQYAIWKGTADALIEKIPTLSEVINTETGEISANSDEIKENIKQWEALAKQKALQQLKEEKLSAIMGKQKDLVDKSIEANVKLSDAEGKRGAALEKVNAVIEKYGGTKLGENATIADYNAAKKSLLDSQFGDEYTQAQILAELGAAASEWTTVVGEANAAQLEVENIQKQIEEGKKAYDDWLAAADELYGGLDADANSATAQAKALGDAVNAIPDEKHISIIVDNGAIVDDLPGRAIGDRYVPFDMPVMVHRGEEIRTATGVRRDRGADLSGLEDRIISAIRAGMSGATVNALVNGQSVTDVVNTRTSNELKGRRFAP